MTAREIMNRLHAIASEVEDAMEYNSSKDYQYRTEDSLKQAHEAIDRLRDDLLSMVNDERNAA